MPITATYPFVCSRSSSTDRHHVLQIVHEAEPERGPETGRDDGGDDTNPFIRYDGRLAWAAHAESLGIDRPRRGQIVSDLDEAIVAVDGTGFHQTPFGRSAILSDALRFDGGGGVWVKDETGGVAGSQKARHLMSILLHLRAVEEAGPHVHRRPLAIASCGNAALAAATLARAANWPIDVYVPTWMSDGFGRRLDALGAHVHRCVRRDDDPPGDPAMFRFREATAGGAIPFTVQGPENALCLDGGRTLGWEITRQAADSDVRLDRVFVQVGGGAFAAATGAALDVPLYAVQTEGCAPLARAWDRAADQHVDSDELGRRWSDLMTVWEDPRSLADGILDDETYDWIGVIEAMRRLGGRPVVAAESQVVRAHQLAHDAGFDASPTGSSGLAGLLAARADIESNERVAVVMSGVTR